jgi:hypothetical protein
MALNRAQYLSPGGESPVLAGEVQGVKQGIGLSIDPFGVISFDSNTATGVVKLRPFNAYNNYIWPAEAPTKFSILSIDENSRLIWTDPEDAVVTKIIPGANITISPASGTGRVTINSVGSATGGLTGLQKIDSISDLFDGSKVTFPILSAGQRPLVGTSTNQLIIVIGGAVQEPGEAYSYDSVNSEVTFSDPPLAGRTFVGWIGGAGDPITAVEAGAGMSGGGTQGDIVLNVGAGPGIQVNIDNVQLAPSGVVAGTYNAATIQVDQYGRVLSATASVTFPSGTILIFGQAAAPAGWTKLTDTRYNDSSIRVVTGNGGGFGGSAAFSTVFSSSYSYNGSVSINSGSVGATTLSTGQMPAHTHPTTIDNHLLFDASGPCCPVRYGGPGGYPGTYFSMSGEGGNQGHSHSLAGVLATGSFTANFAVKYVDVIACRKD